TLLIKHFVNLQKTGHEIKIYIFVRPSLFDPGQF
ncbi:MAG: hypothetical protein RL284_1797, partial [Bacteroidota bacterium]